MTRSGALRLTPAFAGIILAVLGVLLTPAHTTHAAPSVTTDKADYYSTEWVTVSGTGFASNTSYDIPITRPDGSIVHGDGSFLPGWDSITSDASGNFTYYYQLDGVKGTYTINVFPTPWGGPGSGQTPAATNTFTDADIDFTQCQNDNNNDATPDACNWTTGALNASNSIYKEGDGVPQRLFHRVTGTGTFTFAFTYDFSKANPYSYDFITNPDATQSGALLNECGGLPGFITISQCTSMFGTSSFLAPIPSDPFDSVASRENPAGAGARNFKVGCSPACNTSATVSFPDPPVGPNDGESGEAHIPDTDPDCFKNCGSSSVVITVSVTTLSSNTRIGLWFAGHLAQAADPIGTPIGWGAGCAGVVTCGASSISGAPFHIDYTCMAAPSGTCDSVGNRSNQMQIGTIIPPGIIQIIKDAQPNDPQDFSFSGTLGSFLLDDDSDATLPNSSTFIDIVPGTYTVAEAPQSGWTLSAINCSDPDNGTTVALGPGTATIDLDPNETVICTYVNQQVPIDVQKTSSQFKAADCTSPPPASLVAGQSTNVCLVSTLLYNTGAPSSVTVTDTITKALPSDCTASVPSVPNQTLPLGTPVTVTTIISIQCSQPSAHSLQFTNCIAITPPPSPAESNTANNCASANLTVPVTVQSDIKVQSVSLSTPASSAINTAFTVSASASVHNNGPYGPTNVDTTFTLNLPGDCTTSSTNPQTVQNSSLSVSVAASVPASPLTWSVTCTSPSAHQISVSASAAIDQLHVTDPATGNNTASGTGNTNMTTTSDLKLNSVTVSSPASNAVGVPFNVTASASVHNNGPYGPTNADTMFTLSLPADCTTSSANPQTVQNTSLPVSTATAASGPTWSVTCTAASDHNFAMTASAVVDQLHVSDANSANNSGSGSSTTHITATSDIKVNTVSVSSPASNAAGVPFNVSASANEHNNGGYGPTNVDTTFALTLPADCTTTSANPQTTQNTSLAVSAATPVSGPTWSVTCLSASNHTFSATASAAIDQLHVTDPTSGNNSAGGSAGTSITATSDIKVNTVTVSSPPSNATGVAFNVTASAGIQNLGPYGPTNVDTTFTLALPPDCTTSSANPQVAQDTSLAAFGSATVNGISWSVTCTTPSSHSFPVTASAAVDQLHVSDPVSTNNSGSGSSTTAITGQADIKVSGVSVTAPASAAISTPFNVQVTATLHNNGSVTPVNVDTMLALTTPIDCTKSPAGSQVVQDSSLVMSTSAQVSQTWSVSCASPSNHSFSGDANAAIDQLHVSDPTSGNNGATGSGSTNITTSSDLKVNSVTVASPASNAAGSAFNVTATAIVHNNGTYGPTNADTTFTLSLPTDCSTSSANPFTQQDTSLLVSTATVVPLVPATWSVTCNNPSNHNFSVTASVAVDQLHVSDPTSANNSSSSSSTTNITTTSDIKVNGVSLTTPGTTPAGTPFTVTSNAVLHNNGGYGPTNVDTTFTLSLPTDCTTSSTNPQTVQNTSLATSTATTVPASPLSWSVTCTDPSSHTLSVTALAAVDQTHVSDPTPGNNSASKNSVVSVTRTSDIKVNSVSVSSPASNAAGVPFTVSASASEHNNGGYGPTNVDTTFNLSVPADCTTSSANPQTVQNTSLPTSTATTVPAVPVSWLVTCTSPSSHSFSATASAAIDQLHVIDPTSSNNTASGSSSTNITATSDIKVNSVTVTSPASNAAGAAFNVTASASLHNNGPFGPTNVDTTFTLSLPPDCTTSSTNPQTTQDTSLPTSTATTVTGPTWSVTCSTVSSHQFQVSASAAVDQLHVSDPTGGNNSASGSSTTDIGATSDIKVNSVSVSSPASNAAGSAFNVTATASLHNNGPYGPTNVNTTFTLTLPADCTTSSANPQTVANTSLPTSTATTVSGPSWSVTCTGPSNHTFSVGASAAVNQLHVADPNSANNSGTGSSTTSITATTDVKTVLAAVTAPTSASAGTPFNVSATATLHNNGPVGPANTDATFSISLPPDCTTSSGNPQTVQNTSLAVSIATTTSSVNWAVTCTTPSNHQFQVTATAAIDQLHLTDSNAANNSTSGSATTDVGSTADIKVTTTSVSAPANANAGSAFNVTVNATVHNNGPLSPANVDTTFDLSIPADCVRTPLTAQTVQDSSVVASTPVSLSETWSVTCATPSNHSFGGSVTAAEDQLHVDDPNLTNNSGSANGSTAVLASADVKVSSVSVGAPASANAGTAFNVTVTANIHNNGIVTLVNTDTTIDLTVPGDCTRAPNNPQTVQDTGLAPSVAAPVSATWSVTCSGASNHNFSGSASVAIDQLHVSDPTPANNSGSGNATTAVTAQADLKVSSVNVSAPASSPMATAFNVTVSANLHNNGGATANADTTLSLNIPADCTKTPNTTQLIDNTVLATSTATPVSATWSVTCSSPSSHQFTGNASVVVDQLHITDPTATNNSGQGGATTAITGTADVKVSSVSVTSPASANTGSAFNVTVAATVHNNGTVTPVNADTTFNLSAPADCTKSPTGSQVAQDSSLAASSAMTVSKTWSVTCSSQSNHDFSGSASVAVDQLHVSDPNTTNNSGNGGPSTTAVLVPADLKITSISVNAPPVAMTNTAFNVSVNATMHNNGSYSPANADLSIALTVPGDCTKTPNTTQGPQNSALVASTALPAAPIWSVTCTGSGPHSFSGSATVTLDEVLHVTDPNTSNNSASASGSTSISAPTPSPSPSPTPSPSPSPSPPPQTPTPSPSPSPTVAGQTATPAPTPAGGTPVAVGGIVGLIEGGDTPPADDGTSSGDQGSLALAGLGGGALVVLACVWVTRRRLLG